MTDIRTKEGREDLRERISQKGAVCTMLTWKDKTILDLLNYVDELEENVEVTEEEMNILIRQYQD